MPLPHTVARFNKRVTNRFLQPLAQRSPGFIVVHHTGRRSGRPYSTPVNAFTRDRHLFVALTYGPSADWVQNVMAEGGEVEDRRDRRRITSAEVVDRERAWDVVPRPVKAVLRLMGVHHFLQLHLTT